MLVQELCNIGNTILGDKGATTLRLDIRETIDDCQGVGGGIEKMPEVIVVNVPACRVARCIVVLRFECGSEHDIYDARVLFQFTVFQYSLPKLTIKLSPARYSLSVSTLSSPPTISPMIDHMSFRFVTLHLRNMYTWLAKQQVKSRQSASHCVWA
jgi:hypothetical protein